MRTLPELIKDHGITWYIYAAVLDVPITDLRDKLLTRSWLFMDYLRTRVYFRLSDQETLYALMEIYELPDEIMFLEPDVGFGLIVRERLHRRGILYTDIAARIGLQAEAVRKRVQRRYWWRHDYVVIAEMLGITPVEAVRLMTEVDYGK